MAKIKFKKSDAFLAIDVMSTFMPKHKYGKGVIPAGGLPIPNGHEVVAVINDIIGPIPFGYVIATLDRHLKGSVSYVTSFVGYEPFYNLTYKDVKLWTPEKHRIASHAKFTLPELKNYLRRVGFQTLWTEHGLAGTQEAEMHPAMQYLYDDGYVNYILYKGLDPTRDSYSAFRDNTGRKTELEDILHAQKITRIFSAGLTFDFCVGFTAEDGARAGFESRYCYLKIRSQGSCLKRGEN